MTARSEHAYLLVDRDGPLARTLTDAERRVASAAALGISNAAVAQALGISLNTVKTHLRHVYHKLGVRRQSELVLLLNRANAD